ncbi:molecular chaperone [Vibrio sinensis]|uniref:Molecular chaperone n=2 Tax=Vibrio sinensis TaxID=2302434 RepID=A0A3A6QHZ9_9VIBR|nr:molecular chaperone [Vibrio sinensis]
MENMNEQEQQSLRSDIYLLLATLFRQAPNAELIDFLSTLEVEQSESAMEKAWLALREAAQNSNRETLEEEYQNLFIGIGRGEAVLFGSWHMTGSLMEKPLADIRHDLELLGFERLDQVKEPEDHISALCEVMAMLAEEEADLQQAFFNKHIATWYDAFALQVETAKSGDFYRSAAALLRAFGTLEQVQFSKNTKSKSHLKIDVKNVTEYE